MKKNFTPNKIIGLILLLFCETAVGTDATDDQYNSMAQFSGAKKIQLAQLGIDNGFFTMDAVVDKLATLDWNGGNPNLQIEVDNLLVVIGNVNGVTLPQKGIAIKNAIAQGQQTIALSLQQVENGLGGYGDLHTRSQAIQLLIPGANLLEGAQTAATTIQNLNNTIHDNQVATENIYDILITDPAQRGADLLTDITSTRNLLPGLGDLRTRVQALIAQVETLKQDISDIGDALRPLEGQARTFGNYPPLPAEPLTTKNTIVDYIQSLNNP